MTVSTPISLAIQPYLNLRRCVLVPLEGEIGGIIYVQSSMEYKTAFILLTIIECK
jgi:hypothetical protein